MSVMNGDRRGGIVDFDGLRNRCRIDEDTDCHLWLGCTKSGIPQIWIHSVRRVCSASQAIALLTTGKMPKRGRLWYSTCRNSICLNPAHRKEGSLSDAWKHYRPTLSQEHRAAITKATRASNGKITPEIAAAIRANPAGPTEQAKTLPIVMSQVARIKNSGAWRVHHDGASVFAWGGT